MGWLDKYQDGGRLPKAQRGKSERALAFDKVEESTYIKPKSIPSMEEVTKLARIKEAERIANQPMLSEISKEEYEKGKAQAEAIKNTTLHPFERPLIYLANPLKIPGDIIQEFVDHSETLTKNPFPTSEEDRLKIAENRYLSNEPLKGKFIQGLGYVPEAAVNIASGDLAVLENPMVKRWMQAKYYGQIQPSLEAAKSLIKNKQLFKEALFNKDVNVAISSRINLPKFVENELRAGAQTLDEALANKINLLKTPEGRKRLVAQEANYLWQNNVHNKNKDFILKQAEINADSRIFELEHMRIFGNKNANALEEITKPGTKQVKHALQKHSIPDGNAYYKSQDLVPQDDIIREHLDYTDELTGQAGGFTVETVVGGSKLPGELTLGQGFGKSIPTADHEIAHALQRARKGAYDVALRDVQPDRKVLLSNKNVEDAYSYFAGSTYERTPFLAELRSAMKQRGLIKHEYDEITPELLKKAKESFTKKPEGVVIFDEYDYRIPKLISSHRILDFAKQTPKNYEFISKIMNKLPAVAAPVAGAAALSKQKEEGSWMDKYEDGGVIKDDRGQWAHPGKVTEIDSNNITMQGVNYPVLGVSDTGDTKMMMPGENYKFQGSKVTEYPVSGWLDKYNK